MNQIIITMVLMKMVNIKDAEIKVFRAGYEGDTTFEAMGFVKPFPKELYPSAFRLMADVGHYFASEIGKKISVEK